MAKYLMLFSLLVGLTARAEKQPFERYQPIIDRQMFGQPPAGFDPTKMASEVTRESEKELTKEQEQIRSSVHFSIINVTPSGKTAVGFTDNSDPKTPVHYYLKVGESSGGWTLKEADALKAWMKIEKNGVEVELTLGQNSGKGGGTTSRVASAAAAPQRTTASNSASRTPRSGLLARKTNDGGTLQSFAQRKAEREAKRLEEEKRREEEKAQQEAEREEMRQSLADMKEQLAEQRRLREEAKANEEAKAKEKEKAKLSGEGEEQGEDNEGGAENEENDD